MECVELNKVGDFHSWEKTKLKELDTEKISNVIGEKLYENKIFTIWDVTLEPNERIPFRKLASDFTWTCITDGLALTRNINGKIDLVKFKKGDTAHWKYEKNAIISDFENIGEQALKIVIVQHNPSISEKDIFNKLNLI